MANEKDKNKITEPVASKLAAEFFVMPESYRHGKEVAMVEPKQPEKKQLVQTPPVPPPVMLPVKPVLQQPVKKSGTTKAIMIAGAIVIVALSVGGYLLVRSLQKQTIVEQPVPVIPPPREEPVVTESVVEAPIVPVVPQIVPGRDIDSDGLSDKEEQLVYSTNPNLPDTDADGFLDGNEVYHRYNPNGTAPGTLVLSGLAKEYTQGNIRLVYPSIWTVGARTNVEDPAFLNGLLFVSTTGEQIRLSFSSVDSNPNELLTIWTASLKEGAIASKSKAGYKLYVSRDNLEAFLIVANQAIRFQYDPGLKSTVDYLQTFQMMINSVEHTDQPFATNEPTANTEPAVGGEPVEPVEPSPAASESNL